jgi:hypothetical protein
MEYLIGCLAFCCSSALHRIPMDPAYNWGTPELVWALSANLAGGLTAVINLLASFGTRYCASLSGV